MLCGACNTVFSDLNRHPLGSDAATEINRTIVPYSLKATGVHQRSWANLQSSAAAKCHICTLLTKTALKSGNLGRTTGAATFYCVEFPGPQTFQETKDYPASLGFHYTDPSLKRFQSASSRNNHNAFVRFDIVPCSEYQPGKLSQSSITDRRAPVPKFNESIAKRWLHECISSHKQCKSTTDSSWMPSRLVDAGDPQSSIPPRLVVSTQLQDNVEYVTLSHCWGNAHVFKLERRNFMALRASIPVDKLPRTFQDAMHIVRRLGYRYLWIDSLCIIQDSKEDWSQEAILMNMVYKHARLNIAATGAEDSEGGCLFDYDQDAILFPQIELTFDLGQLRSQKGHGIVYKLESKIVRRKYYLIRAEPSWIKELEGSRLLNRAWVFQERLLSPRVLHFHRAQLFWECRELRAFESCPDGMPPERFLAYPYLVNTYMKDILPSAYKITLESNTASTFEDTEYHSKSWAEFVTAYTAAGLSYPQDKLIALSGIAAEIQEKRGDSFLAGLWKRALPLGLLWSGRANATRSANFRAPSWSWASMDGGIFMEETVPTFDVKDISLAEVVDAQIITSGNQNTGEVKAGYLKLQGSLGHCQWKQYPGWGKSSAAISESDPIQPNKDIYGDRVPVKRLEVDFDDPADTIAKYDAVYCLPLVEFIDMTRGEGHDYIMGLILIQNVSGQFQRIARFTHGWDNEKMKFSSWPNRIVEIV